MSIKPTRNELLDAIAVRISNALEAELQECQFAVADIRTQISKLEKERDAKRSPDYSQFLSELVEVINAKLASGGFKPVSNFEITGEGNLSHPYVGDQATIVPRLYLGSTKAKKPVKMRPTKRLDKKIAELQEKQSELMRKKAEIENTSRQWEVNENWPSRTKATRQRIIARLIERDQKMIKQIDDAAKLVAADADDLSDNIIGALTTNQKLAEAGARDDG